ncbi:valacyclovir hydrolase isoform X2 [Bos indicus]|uniref:Valacyclovir hydrolase isoform X2 n=1 Tax=Bos indicus TaxID=9915 RepID=A0ABM4RGA2_BOSIN|nr:valacyclovir hydrolase isoform X1 [Bos taurus]
MRTPRAVICTHHGGSARQSGRAADEAPPLSAEARHPNPPGRTRGRVRLLRDLRQGGGEWRPPALPADRRRRARRPAAPGDARCAGFRGVPGTLSSELGPQSQMPRLGSGETDFGPQIENLNKKLFTVVAWDPRGYGHSRPPDRDFPVDFFERDAKDAIDLMKTLKFKKVSLLGWSDGGITALIAAARYPSYVSKMVIWGANAYVTEQDTEIYQGIRDVSKWSEKTRKPLEALYGFDYFARTCEKWVDGIEQFKHLPDGYI